MPKMDIAYTMGVIATKEKYLLKDRVLRLAELSPDEAFRFLLETGYGGGAETTASVYDFEKLIQAEEEKLDAFIREYAPNRRLSAYLLAPRDFHNAKALVKAFITGEDDEKMLAPDGLVQSAVIKNCVQTGDFSSLYPALASVCEKAMQTAKDTEISGAELGLLFEKAQAEYIVSESKGFLKKVVSAKTDMTNILTALRSVDEAQAKENFLPGGTLPNKKLLSLFDTEKALSNFKRTDYYSFVQSCLDAKEKGLPMTQAEKTRDSYDIAQFEARKYELVKTEPFLYYIYRRKLENENVRIVFVCLLAGLSEAEIKRRLRGV